MFHRIVILIIVVVVTISAFWGSNLSGVKTIAPVEKILPSVIHSDATNMDVAIAEQSWNRLEFDENNLLKVNEFTEAILVDVFSLLDQPATTPQLNRVGFLLEKQFSLEVSQQVVSLLPVLQHYKLLEQQWLADNANQQPPNYPDLFRLQDEVLGEEIASKLFLEQRRLMNMMRASYEIQNNRNLTDQQKQDALNALQTQFATEVGNE